MTIAKHSLRRIYGIALAVSTVGIAVAVYVARLLLPVTALYIRIPRPSFIMQDHLFGSI